MVKKICGMLIVFMLCYLNFGKSVVFAEEDRECVELPSVVKEYVTNNEDKLLWATEQVLYYNEVEIEDESLYFANAYIIGDLDADIQDEIYYIPVAAGERVVAVIAVIGSDGFYTHNISCDKVSVLNEMNYLTEACIFYKKSGVFYAENDKKVISSELLEIDVEGIFEGNVSRNVADYNSRKSEVLGRIKSMRKCTKPQLSDKQKESLKLKGTVTLRSPQGQYAYDMCWASSVATVVNTLRNNGAVVTGFEVCSRLGIGYNDGGTIYDASSALYYYNILYNEIRHRVLWRAELDDNINGGKPVLVTAVPNVDNPIMGHMVTIYGYENDEVFYWDSNLNNGSGGYASFAYSDSGEFFEYEGVSYSWQGSLSYE